jgi:hypothetical protein
MDPLFSLGTLATNVKQFEIQVLEGKVDFHNTSGFDSGPQNVLFGWLILFGTKPIEIIQEIFG